MGYISGKGGAVNGVPEVRVWDMNAESIGGPYASSASAGAVDRIVGSNDWTGRYGAYGDMPAVLFDDSFAFVGSVDGSVGVYGTAVVTQIRIDIEIPQEPSQPPTPIAHVVEFKANGVLHKGAAVAADATVPNPPNPKDLNIQYAVPAASPSWIDLNGSVHRASLILRRPTPVYRRGKGYGFTNRVTGHFDAHLEFGCYVSAFTSTLEEGEIYGIKLYTSPTRTWLIDWMLCEALNEMKTPIEEAGFIEAGTRALVSMNPRLSLKSVTLIDAVATRGSITAPDSSVIWPITP